MTDAEIAGIMGWRGPGAYTEASMRKVRLCIEQARQEEREACAGVVKNFRDNIRTLSASASVAVEVCDTLESAIRARGEKGGAS